MRDTVLIMADDADMHASVVAARLAQNYATNCVRWSFSRFPQNDRLVYTVNGTDGLRVTGSDGVFDLERLRAIWWRRPGRPLVSPEIEPDRVRRFASSECEHFLLGVFDSMGIPSINHPHRQKVAARKPYQLKAALDAGLRVPKTLMTNDSDEIRKFWSDLDGRCVYKAFSSPPWTALETRMMTAADIESLDAVALAPIIVQEKIERDCDVRINIFGDQVFAAKVEPRHPIAEVDSRFDITAIWEPITLPSEIQAKVILLLSVLGLEYGCVDMRRQPDGDFVFFEINPAGQFLFAEIDTEQPLSDAMAGLLFRADHHSEVSQLCSPHNP